MDAFLNDYEITNVETDYVQSADIEWWINSQDLGISMMKFGMEITKYAAIHKYTNVYSKVKKVGGKNTRCWYGVKKVEEIYVGDDNANSNDGTDIIY